MLELEQLDLDPISEICVKLYPNQVNVLQATTQIQYWLNGPDPLDYINIYLSNDELTNASHFHFVSLGLTDLYGDERVHKKIKSLVESSGYGYELTMRVRKPYAQKKAPKWPIKLMQALARYTFNHGALLDSGDHIPNVINEKTATDEDSIIKHVLIADDFQLNTHHTRLGTVKFIQIVGCTDDELLFAQQWSTRKVLELMRQCEELGRDHLLTDINRTKSIFEMYPELKQTTIQSIKNEGSNLSFVKSHCYWKISPETEVTSASPEFRLFNNLSFYLDLKTAQLLPIILRQRLLKENSFIFNGIDSRNLILIPSNFKNTNCFVSSTEPLKTDGTQCQVLLTNRTICSLIEYFQIIKIEKRSYKDLPIRQKFHLVQTTKDKLDENEAVEEHNLIINIVSRDDILNGYSSLQYSY